MRPPERDRHRAAQRDRHADPARRDREGEHLRERDRGQHRRDHGVGPSRRGRDGPAERGERRHRAEANRPPAPAGGSPRARRRRRARRWRRRAPSCSVRSAAVRSAAYEPSEAPETTLTRHSSGEHGGARAMTGGGEHDQRLDGDERERRVDRRADDQRVDRGPRCRRSRVTARPRTSRARTTAKSAGECHAADAEPRGAACHQPWG